MTRIEYIIDDDFLDDETKMSAESQGYLWELIRCKDCKNWLEYKQGGVGECVINHRYDHRSYVTNGKDYCSRAERRTDAVD